MRTLAAALLFCYACAAQNTLTAEQLIGFVKSSVERKMTDVEISRYLRTVKLNQRLSDAQFEDLLTVGLGQRTLQALHAIHDQGGLVDGEVPSLRREPLQAVLHFQPDTGMEDGVQGQPLLGVAEDPLGERLAIERTVGGEDSRETGLDLAQAFRPLPDHVPRIRPNSLIPLGPCPTGDRPPGSHGDPWVGGSCATAG